MPVSASVGQDRLQKFLARAGISSRRRAEELIAAGRVRVDGRLVTELGTKVDSTHARVDVDGRRVISQPPVYILLHKPRGTVTTLRDPEGRPTVASLVANVGHRIVPVGRLDYATSGVLLMTNDGEFQAKLQHASHGARKVYHAKVRGVVDAGGLERWRRSIEIEGHATRPAQVEILQIENDKTWLSITLNEGKNRQIRRLGEQAGHLVLRLIRVEYAGLTVSGLRPGAWRHLSRQELLELKQAFGVPRRIPHVAFVEPPENRRAPVSKWRPTKERRTRHAAFAEPAENRRAPASKSRRSSDGRTTRHAAFAEPAENRRAPASKSRRSSDGRTTRHAAVAELPGNQRKPAFQLRKTRAASRNVERKDGRSSEQRAARPKRR